MITADQVRELAGKFKSNQATVFREYLQALFLSRLYRHKDSALVFFKGGTAIHLLWEAPRFSEDLDFTVMLSEKKFNQLIGGVFDQISREGEVNFKQRKTIAGKRFLLTAAAGVLPYATFINLDFSFGEKVRQPDKSTLDTPYPIVFNSFIYHLSAAEVAAEKIRALLTRQKSRDLFDLWFLMARGTKINSRLVKRKLRYYKIQGDGLKTLRQKVGKFSETEFIADMRPFVTLDERGKLKDRFGYIKSYLLEKLEEMA